MSTPAKLPKTYAAASEMLEGMKSRRSDLSRFCETNGPKRRDLALAAQLHGDDTALRQHDQTIDAAWTEHADLNSAIEALASHANTLRVAEEDAEEKRAEANRVKLIDELLVLDDEIDAALDAARDLLLRRREMVRSNRKVLRVDLDLSDAIMAYFDLHFPAIAFGSHPYGEIWRIAETDGKMLDRVSPATALRPPRGPGKHADVARNFVMPFANSAAGQEYANRAIESLKQQGARVNGVVHTPSLAELNARRAAASSEVPE